MAAREIKKDIPELSNPYNEEMVEIQLFKDGKKYKDDLVIGRNSEIYQIQRGVRVRVPKGIYEIIENSERQDILVAEKIRELEKTKEK